MERFTNSLRSSVDNQNWYVALSSALTLPDVCGRLVEPNEKSSERRYSNWFKAWMERHYTFDLMGRPGQVFLTGGDCYALRCSYLHEGGADISAQRARKALDSFHFISPPTNGFIIHSNQMHGVLQLQVDIFCRQVADAVDMWAASVVSDVVIQERMKSLLTIHTNVPGLMDYNWG